MFMQIKAGNFKYYLWPNSTQIKKTVTDYMDIWWTLTVISTNEGPNSSVTDPNHWITYTGDLFIEVLDVWMNW